MKSVPLYLFSFLCCLICTQCRSIMTAAREEATSEIPKIDGYQLVWNDEFDIIGKPNSDYWSHENGLVRNNELQYYQPENTQVTNGLLVIEGRREKVKNAAYEAGSSDWRKKQEYADYSASSIHTRGKKEFQYGIFEVRAKLDTTQGMWPAIWTLGVSKRWPANGEIDLMEYYRIDGKPHILANAAWLASEGGAAWDSKKIPFSKFLEKDPDWPNKFHIWKMEWTSDYIRLYLDGEVINNINLDKTNNPDGFNPFHQPHYILLNLAIGSNGGDPAKTPFPKKYEVDYVRVYQKKIK